MFGNELFNAAFCGNGWVAGSAQSNRAFAFAMVPPIGNRYTSRRGLSLVPHAVRHTHGFVRLAECQTRDGRDCGFRNELPNERDAATPTVVDAPANVKAEVDLVEILVQGYRYTCDARPKKPEADDADERTIAEKVDLGSRGDALGQKRRIDSVVEQRKVAPLSR